jgi:thioredoxin 1
MAGFIKSLFGRREDKSSTGAAEPAILSDAEPIHVTDATFNESVLESSLPVLVDFWAPWCGPCRMIAPILEDLAKKYDGRAVVAKVNTDEHKMHADRLGIMGIPTLIFFKGGEEIDRIVGFAPKRVFESKLEELLT